MLGLPRLSASTLLVSLLNLTTATQYAFQSRANSSSAVINFDSFTTFTHPAFLDAQLRIKRNDGWCDKSSVKSYSGYIDVHSGSLFFYYFESRRDPAKDDVVLWINGGPGCSSSMGLLMELGPCQIVEEGPLNATQKTRYNPHSWNQVSNLLFLDQPVGVGFSYGEHGIHVGTSEKAAKDVYTFLTLFFETFSELKGRPFHIAGESYAGRYIPVFAGAIVDGNTKAVAGGFTPINLRSVMIGNGMTDLPSAVPTYYDMACTAQSPSGPVLPLSTCAQLQATVPFCTKWINKVCVDSYEITGCDAALEYCQNLFMQPYLEALRNPYDVSKPCPTLREDLCYSATSRIKKFLDNPEVRKKLGVREGTGAFASCNDKVGMRFANHKDAWSYKGATTHYVTALLERKIDVLVYAGKWDWICNYMSNQAWAEALEWTGSMAFQSDILKAWSIPKSAEAAGEWKTGVSTTSGARLAFVTIDKAGHMAPYDQPEASLHMVTAWLSSRDFSS